jgi:hypothetical protein
VYVVPFQLYEVQADSVAVDWDLYFMVSTIVMAESHPATFVVIKVFVPDEVYEVPLQV